MTHFSIAPQPLESALVELATQGNVSLSLPAQGFGDRRSRGLAGAYTVERALDLMLAQSDFRYQRVGDRAFRVEAAARDARSPPPPIPQEDIIVTAARRPTPLGNLPRSITVLDAHQFAQSGAAQDSDLVRVTSGLAFTNLGQGRDKILLRGISDGPLTGSAQSLVGLYFDDTRITYAAPDPDLRLVDISSIDILRGPQGALYGAGSIGGIVRITANPVDLTRFAGSLAASVEGIDGGGIGRAFDLVFNAPLFAGRAGLRGVYYDQQRAGWLDNATIGQTNANASHRRGARLQALVELSPHWSVSAGAVSQTIDTADAQYLERTPTGPRRTASLLEPHDNDFLMFTGAVQGSTRWGDVTSSTSLVTHELSSRYDVTGQFAGLVSNPAVAGPLDQADALSIIVHETRLSSPDGARLPWFVGFFYADGDNTRDLVLTDGAATAYNEHRVDNIDETALFGEVSWQLTPTLSLSTGARVFLSRLSTQSLFTEPGLSQQDAFSDTLSDSGFAPDVRLSFQPTRRLLFYLSAAEGYRSGGFNTGGPVGAGSSATQPFRRYRGDEIWTYEAGARVTLLGDRLDVQAVAFANDWRDIQSDALLANGFTYTGNVGDARTVGFEFDARYLATDHLILQAHGLINEPELTRVNTSFPMAASGGLPGSPEYSGSASVRYEDELSFAGHGASWFAQLDANYIGAAALGFGQGAPVGNYAEADARIGVTTEAWQATLYASNLTGADGPTFSAGNPYQPARTLETPIQPLTIGFSLKRNF